MTEVVSVGAFPVADYLAIFHRQRWRMLVVGAAILTIAAALVAYWPATYRSSATIMIREADVPPDFVRSPTTVFADERLRAIQQRITTSQNLTAIIRKLRLYDDKRGSKSTRQMIEEMRSNIGLSIISADTTSKGGRDVKAAIAFTLWFDADNPRTAQQVASELVTLYLSERKIDREKRASATTGFLKGEALRLQRDVQALEAEIESFKSRYAGYLPEDRTINTQLLDRIDNQILELTREARARRERLGMLRGQLAKTERYLPVIAEQTASSPDAQLAMFEGKLATMRARYGDKHPDVLALDRQINALKSAGATSRADSGALALQIQSLTADLESTKRQYGARHPDVAKLERELKAKKAQLGAASVPAATEKSSMNPGYSQLQIQLASVESELATTTNQLRALEEKRGRIEERISKAPAVERSYAALKRDYEATVDRYLEIRAKESEAELVQNLESERVGETLVLTEPPDEPVNPIRPNRRIILAIGLAAAIAGAGLAGIIFDALDGRVHGWRQVAFVTGRTPFATIPVIRTATDRRKGWAAGAAKFLLAASSAAVAVVYIHYVLIPLDGLWAETVTRLGLTQWFGIAASQATQ